jgi:hypothetical protein
MRERRRSPRFTVQHVHGRLVFQAAARLLALGPAGATLELEAPVRVGKELTLTLSGDGTVRRAAVVVTGCEAAGTRDDAGGEPVEHFTAEVRWAEPDPDADPIAELLEPFEGETSATLGEERHARLRLAAPRPVDLAAVHPLEVRKISRSGMLVDTDLEAELDSQIDLDVGLDGERLDTSGRVAYVIELPLEAAENGRRYRLGIEFVGLGAAGRATLDAFLAGLR